MTTEPCPHCGEMYVIDNAWHSWNIHVGSCKKNPRVIRMNEFHDNRPKEMYNSIL